MKFKHPSLSLLTVSIAIIFHLNDVASVSPSNSRKRKKPKIPDLNFPVTSPFETEAASETVVNHQDSRVEKNDEQYNASPISYKKKKPTKKPPSDEKRLLRNAKLNEKRKMEREQYHNRHNLGLSQEEIAKIEDRQHRYMEAKRKHASRTSKEVWSRLRQGSATRSDMTIIERSRVSNRIWRERHPEADAKRKRKWLAAKKDGKSSEK